MNKRMWGAAAAAFVLGFGLPSAGAAAAFVNGGFESPGGAPVRRFLADGDTFVTGWTNQGGFQIYESDGQDGIEAGEGDYYVSFGHSGATGGSLSQTFDTVAGALYTLTYLVRQQQGLEENTGFRISASTGDSVEVLNPSSAAWAAGTPLRFTGTGGQVTLTILDISTTGGATSNLAIDGLDLRVGAGAPEPLTWAMMIVGFGGVGGILRLRRRGDGWPRRPKARWGQAESPDR